MRIFAVFLLSLLLAGCQTTATTPPLTAQDADELACSDSAFAPDGRVEACTRMIADKTYSGRDVAVAYTNRGDAQQVLGKQEEALADYAQAIHVWRYSPRAYLGRDRLLGSSEGLDTVKALLKRQVDGGSRDQEILYDYAWLQTQSGERGSAMEALSRAIADDPNFVAGLRLRATVRLSLSKNPDFLKDLDKALAVNSNDPLTHYMYGVALQRLERHKDALASFREAIRLYPDYVSAYYQRGRSYEAIDVPSRAREAYGETKKRNPRHARAHYRTALLWKKWFKPNQALEDFDRAIEADPSYTDAYLDKAILLTNQGDLERAEPVVMQVIERGDPPWQAFMVLSSIRYQEGKYQQAIAETNKAILLNDSYPRLFHHRALAYLRVGEIGPAIKDFVSAAGSDPALERSYREHLSARGFYQRQSGSSSADALRTGLRACLDADCWFAEPN